MALGLDEVYHDLLESKAKLEDPDPNPGAGAGEAGLEEEPPQEEEDDTIETLSDVSDGDIQQYFVHGIPVAWGAGVSCPSGDSCPLAGPGQGWCHTAASATPWHVPPPTPGGGWGDSAWPGTPPPGWAQAPAGGSLRHPVSTPMPPCPSFCPFIPAHSMVPKPVDFHPKRGVAFVWGFRPGVVHGVRPTGGPSPRFGYATPPPPFGPSGPT